MPPFVKIQKNRKPKDGEKSCPVCSGTGRVNTHVCATCHGAGAVPEAWKSGDGPVKATQDDSSDNSYMEGGSGGKTSGG
jgi:DnaJ-class molecular chaperone